MCCPAMARALRSLIVEFILPFLILMPRRPRALSVLAIALFQLLIVSTGSCNFSKLLTLCLCLPLLDDQRVGTNCPGILRQLGIVQITVTRLSAGFTNSPLSGPVQTFSLILPILPAKLHF